MSLLNQLRGTDIANEQTPAIEESIRAHIECLLNTHCCGYSGTERLSLQHYGLLDFSHWALDQSKARQQLANHIRRLLQYFEPRLSQIDVMIYLDKDRDSLAQRYLSMDITAVIKYQQQHVSTQFTSVFDQKQGVIKITGTHHE